MDIVYTDILLELESWTLCHDSNDDGGYIQVRQYITQLINGTEAHLFGSICLEEKFRTSIEGILNYLPDHVHLSFLQIV